MAEPDSQTIDTEKVEGIIAEWDAALSTYSGAVEGNTAAQNPCLVMLKDAGLDQGFMESFDNNFKALAESLKSVSSSLKTAVGYIEEQDDDNRRGMPGGSGRRGGGGGGGGDKPPEDTTEPPSSGGGVDNVNLQIAEYSKMDMSDLQGVVAALQKAATDNNMTIEELLGDKQNAELIQKTLLGCIKNEELRKLLEAGDIELSRQLIVNILTGEEPSIVGMDSETVLTLEKYLTNIATDNNMTINDLIGKPENTKLLKTSLSSFGDVGKILSSTKSEDLIDTMKNINDGNYSNPEIKDVAGAVGILRGHLSVLAEKNNIENEEDVISSEGYADALKTLGRFSVFTNNATNFNDENMVQLIKNAFYTLKTSVDTSAEGSSK